MIYDTATNTTKKIRDNATDFFIHNSEIIKCLSLGGQGLQGSQKFCYVSEILFHYYFGKQ